MKIFWFWIFLVAALLEFEVFAKSLKTTKKSPIDKISSGDATRRRQKRYIVWGGGPQGQGYGYGQRRPYGQPDYPLDKLVRVREGMRNEWYNLARGIPNPYRPQRLDLQKQALHLNGYN
ncbi:unnamed protein product [Cylicocyclus nassatus]|uniref:Uncharacterized protein n=1 Tax=Cylicocyclus nassatus TaxID=53992 RepID=A0AA36GU05_CYLNA|nr:unnamed protein product [Cylicocyclus nassatus]